MDTPHTSIQRRHLLLGSRWAPQRSPARLSVLAQAQRRHRHRRLDPADRRVRLRRHRHQCRHRRLREDRQRRRRHQGPQGQVRARGHRLQGRRVGGRVQEDHQPEQGQPVLRRLHRLLPKPSTPNWTASGTILMAGASFATGDQRPAEVPEPVSGRPRLHRDDRHPAASTSPRKSPAPRSRSSTPTPSSAATRSRRSEADSRRSSA